MGIKFKVHCQTIADHIEKLASPLTIALQASRVTLCVEGNISAGKSTFLDMIKDTIGPHTAVGQPDMVRYSGIHYGTALFGASWPLTPFLWTSATGSPLLMTDTVCRSQLCLSQLLPGKTLRVGRTFSTLSTRTRSDTPTHSRTMCS